jgi:hypothetical protein
MYMFLLRLYGFFLIKPATKVQNHEGEAFLFFAEWHFIDERGFYCEKSGTSSFTKLL